MANLIMRALMASILVIGSIVIRASGLATYAYLPQPGIGGDDWQKPDESPYCIFCSYVTSINKERTTDQSPPCYWLENGTNNVETGTCRKYDCWDG